VWEYGFELALCARLEGDQLVSRQLGTGVHGRRIVDVVCLSPGPAFDSRAAITDRTIPPAAIESDVGPGTARRPTDALDCHPDRAADVVEEAVECGFFERERRNGRVCVRQTTRYPEAWFDRIVGIENKPDLGRPGALETQLLTDVHLGLVDEVVLATASHVTGAHFNRIPDPVGVWEFDPDTGEREILRDPDPLPVDEAGVEIVDRSPTRTEIRVATAGEKFRARRRLAERAYGKGWRPEPPACERVAPDADGLPDCPYRGRLVEPARDCGPACGGHEPARPPAVDHDRLRADRTPWVADPEGRQRRQSRLDRYE